MRRKTKCIVGLDEAKEAERALAAELKNGGQPFARLTVQALYDEYIKVKESEVRKSSLNKTKSILKNHVLNSGLEKKNVDRLSKRDLQEWKSQLSEKPIMISTKNNAIRELNALLNYAVKLEYISKNPLREIGRFKDAYFTTAAEKIHYYTSDQFKRYITVAWDSRKTLTDYACYIFFMMAFFTGMRKGELNALKWSDIDGTVVHVRRSICQKVKGYEETPPKNRASYRDLKIPQKVKTILDEWKSELLKHYEESEIIRVCGGLKPIPDTVIENHNAQYAKSAGLPHIRVHDFRHSHATFLINSGVIIKEVSRRLGHSDVKTTWNTYAHLYPSAEESVLNALDTAI